MTTHVRPETPIGGGPTILVCPDGQRINADAVPALLKALATLVENGGIGPESMFDAARDAIADAIGQGNG